MTDPVPLRGTGSPAGL